MSSNNHSLRVALLFQGTVYREQAFTRTSEPVVTLGDGEKNDFITPDGTLDSTFEMFERGEEGYTIRLPENLGGTVHLNDEELSVADLIEERGSRVDSIPSADGPTDVYEIELREGDWGLLEIGDIEVFFQMMGRPDAIGGRGAEGIDMPVVAAIAVAAFAHAAFLISCFLVRTWNPTLHERQIPDRFVELSADDVDDPLEKDEEEEPEEDTTGKKAGGEEGKFGKEDSEQEDSKVPNVDGPMKKKIDVKNLGVNKMLASKNLGSGPLKNIFGNQDGFDSKMKVAMSGEGSDLQVGRGAGGMGLRGTGAGGGGEGFGRVGGLGKVDTGGGKGTGAKIGEKEKKKVEPNMSRGSPNVGDYCDPQNIKRVVSGKSNAIQYCYERELQTNPELSGKVVAQWKVGLDGQVKSASVANSTINNSKVESCVTRVIKRMRFEEPDGGICIINYPFVFSGGQ